jgi:hypothetical protein
MIKSKNKNDLNTNEGLDWVLFNFIKNF